MTVSLAMLTPTGFAHNSRRSIQIAALSMSVALTACAPSNESAPGLTTVGQIPDLMGAFDVDGLAVTAVRGDEILLSEGFGVTVEGDVYTSSSQCGLYSATKVLASLTYTNLSKDGRINLDGQLGSYLDDAPPEWRGIPFYRLLNHTSGITMIVNKPEFGALVSNPAATNDDIYRLVRDAPFDYQPGEYSRYRQSGYAVGEIILRDIVGKSFDALVTEYITQPAGMANTTHPGLTNDSEPAFLLSAGGYRTTADDMARLFLGINNGTVVKPLEWKALLQDEKYLFENYSLGSVFEEQSGVLTLGHSGGGARANVRYAPDQKIGVMVCTDDRQNNALAISLARMLVHEIATGEVPKTPVRVALNGDKTGAEIVAAYNLVAEQVDRYDFAGTESLLNRIGYGFLAKEQLQDAIDVFSLNVELFPQSPNVHDSLGEALLASGDEARALLQYREVLSLDRNNENAIVMIKKILAGDETNN